MKQLTTVDHFTSKIYYVIRGCVIGIDYTSFPAPHFSDKLFIFGNELLKHSDMVFNLSGDIYKNRNLNKEVAYKYIIDIVNKNQEILLDMALTKEILGTFDLQLLLRTIFIAYSNGYETGHIIGKEEGFILNNMLTA